MEDWINWLDLDNRAQTNRLLLVVEAMASHRPYRPAWSIDVALNEIKKNRGLLYDAKVVDACINLFVKKKFKFD